MSSGTVLTTDAELYMFLKLFYEHTTRMDAESHRQLSELYLKNGYKLLRLSLSYGFIVPSEVTFKGKIWLAWYEFYQDGEHRT